MAGERLRVPGWTEVSAVCTRATERGRGLATALVGEIVAGVHSRGDEAMLHVAATNTSAVSLYETLGFSRRRTMRVVVMRSPEDRVG
jgi:predicted GNAT family acetyltransferase